MAPLPTYKRAGHGNVCKVVFGSLDASRRIFQGSSLLFTHLHMEALQSGKPDSPRPSDSSSSSSSDHSHSQSSVKIEDGIAVEIVRTNSKADVEANAQVLKPSTPPDFPEGGLRAWLTVLGGYVISTFSVIPTGSNSSHVTARWLLFVLLVLFNLLVYIKTIIR